MSDTSTTTEVITINAQGAVAKMGTATGGAIWGMSSWSMNDLVAALTCIFVLLQIGLLVPKYTQLIRAWRKGGHIKVEIN